MSLSDALNSITYSLLPDRQQRYDPMMPRVYVHISLSLANPFLGGGGQINSHHPYQADAVCPFDR